jgi:hypothetical protein
MGRPRLLRRACLMGLKRLLGLSIPFFFVTTYAWVLWIVLLLLVARWNHRRRRPPPGRQPDGPGPDATGPAGSATQLDQEPT